MLISPVLPSSVSLGPWLRFHRFVDHIFSVTIMDFNANSQKDLLLRKEAKLFEQWFPLTCVLKFLFLKFKLFMEFSTLVQDVHHFWPSVSSSALSLPPQGYGIFYSFLTLLLVSAALAFFLSFPLTPPSLHICFQCFSSLLSSISPRLFSIQHALLAGFCCWSSCLFLLRSSSCLTFARYNFPCSRWPPLPLIPSTP